MKVKFNFNKNHLLAFVIIIFLLTVLYLMRSRGRVRESFVRCKNIKKTRGECSNAYRNLCAVGRKKRRKWNNYCSQLKERERERLEREIQERRERERERQIELQEMSSRFKIQEK